MEKKDKVSEEETSEQGPGDKKPPTQPVRDSSGAAAWGDFKPVELRRRGW